LVYKPLEPTDQRHGPPFSIVAPGKHSDSHHVPMPYNR
jgi:hypothetical protein